MSCKFSFWHAIQEIESLLHSSLIVKPMNSLLDSFHSISLSGIIFPKGLKLHIISIPLGPAHCNNWEFMVTFCSDFHWLVIKLLFSFPGILAATPGKKYTTVNKIRLCNVCSIKQRIFFIIFLLFHIREKQNYKFIQNSYCFLFHNVTILKSCTQCHHFLSSFIKLLMFSMNEEIA